MPSCCAGPASNASAQLRHGSLSPACMFKSPARMQASTSKPCILAKHDTSSVCRRDMLSLDEVKWARHTNSSPVEKSCRCTCSMLRLRGARHRQNADTKPTRYAVAVHDAHVEAFLAAAASLRRAGHAEAGGCGQRVQSPPASTPRPAPQKRRKLGVWVAPVHVERQHPNLGRTCVCVGLGRWLALCKQRRKIDRLAAVAIVHVARVGQPSTPLPTRNFRRACRTRWQLFLMSSAFSATPMAHGCHCVSETQACRRLLLGELPRLPAALAIQLKAHADR